MKDQHVIDNILSRNAAGVEMAVNEHRVSVCGYGPIMALMEYSGLYDSEYKVEILARGHSGDVSPSREVVDYVSIILITLSSADAKWLEMVNFINTTIDPEDTALMTPNSMDDFNGDFLLF